MKPNSIHSFRELSYQFFKRFEPSYTQTNANIELSSVKQRPKETLKQYIERFQEALDANPGYDKHNAYLALRCGLQPCDLVGKLAHRGRETVDDLLALAQQYIAREETIEAQRKLHGTGSSYPNSRKDD